jgi:hypothetical protein
MECSVAETRWGGDRSNRFASSLVCRASQVGIKAMRPQLNADRSVSRATSIYSSSMRHMSPTKCIKAIKAFALLY